MLKYMIGVLVGGAIGAAMGSTRSCETGSCPLTSNPYVGAIYGGIMGLLIVSAFLGTKSNAMPTAKEDNAMAVNASSSVTQVNTKDEFRSQVLDAQIPVLVDLWAPWCGPCRAQSPIVDQVAAQAGDRARVVKVNVDDAYDVADELGVQSIPTLVVFRGGKEQARFVGVQSADVLNHALGL